MKKDIERLLKKQSGVRLDIACGFNKQPGFVGIDIREGPEVDIVWDLEQYPWPLPDESVIMAVCSHYIEHINPHGGGFLRFMDEVWRILKPRMQLAVITPYGNSLGYLQDPTHCNPVVPGTFAYFDPLQDNAEYYHYYEPKPWKIEDIAWNPDNIIEVVLSKRPDDRSYHREANHG